MNSDSLDITTLEDAIKRHTSILFSYINFDDLTVGIHLNSNLGKDYPRMMFILFTLSRVYAGGYGDVQIANKRKEVLIVFWAIYEHAKKHLEEKDFMYVALYGIRFLNNLGESCQRLVSDFAAVEYSTLYGYPVSTYLYISTYKECEALRTGYDFSSEILSQCKKAFDFWLFSNVRDSLLPFHFAELSFHTDLVPDELIERSYNVVVEKFSKGYLQNEQTSSSGVAKCMEDFARRGDMIHFKKSLDFLEGRKLSNFKHYLKPDQAKNADVFFAENPSSQYVCLDTNAHLLHAYLNLYEKKE